MSACEEYVLGELYDYKKKLGIATKENEELHKQLESQPSTETIEVNRNSGVFYSYSVTGYFSMGELLKKVCDDNVLMHAKQCLRDRELLAQLIKKDRNSYSNENNIKEYNYQILLQYAGRDYAIIIHENSDSIYCLDDKRNYHENSKELANKNMLNEFIENLKEFIEREEKKLEVKTDENN